MRGLPVAGRQGKFTFRLLAIALLGQAVILSFFALVARANAIAAGHPQDGSRLLWVGLGLAVFALVAGGMMRRPFGITLGWLVQLLTLASGTLVTVMYGVGVVFLALWVLLIVQGRSVDELVAAREREASDVTPEPAGGASAAD